MRLSRWLALWVVVAALAPEALAGKWVWTPDTGWQDINKLPRETPKQRYNYAVALATDGKFESALATFEELLKPPKSDVTEGCLYYAGFCRQHMRDYWQAYKVVEDLFRSYPETKFKEAALRTELAAGKEMAHAGSHWALEVLEAVVRRDPEGLLGAEAQLEIGHCHFARGRYPEARSAYQTMVTKFRKSPYTESAAFRRAESDVKMVQLRPKDAAALGSAKADLKEYLAQYPKGQWAEQAADYVEAVQKLAEAKDADTVEFYRALLDHYQGRYSEICGRFKRLAWRLRGSELGEQSQFYYADCLGRMGDTYGAIKAFEKMFAKYGTGMMARRAVDREFALSKEMMKTNRDKAIWAFGRVVANEPTGPLAADAQTLMADLYLEQKDIWNAKTSYQTVLTAYPDSAWCPKALFRVGLCALKEARAVNVPSTYLNEAQDKLEDYLSRYPEGADVEEVKGKIGEVKEMKAQVAYETGMWYLGRGKREAAVIYFVSVLREFPETKWAGEARKAVTKLKPEALSEGS